MKTVVVPLDDRPCNHAWVKKYAWVAGIDLAIFPAANCGDLHQGLDHDALYPWLEKELNDADYLLVAADAVTSGGLIQAREATFTLKDALSRISTILELKKRHPYLKLYVMDTIMRTTVTTKDEASREHWENVNAYSHALGMAHFTQEEKWTKEVKRLEEKIPNKVLTTYLEARRKKHILNQYLCNLVSFSDIDHLLLLQEDTTEKGIQAIENDIILNMVDKLDISENVTMSNGTDEGTLVLFAKMLLEASGQTPDVSITLPDDGLKDVVMPFEDRPVWENIVKTAEVIGLNLTDERQASYHVAVYAEANPKRFDLTKAEPSEPDKNNQYKQFVNHVNALLDQNEHVVLVDLLHANGGNKTLLDDIDHDKLLAYSAWNTATNSLGSALALIGTHAYGNDPDMTDFLYERIIDDCLYQSYVRINVNAEAIKEGINIHDMGEDATAIEKAIKKRLETMAKPYTTRPFKVGLPWKRTFEIDIDMEG